jgi:GH15 family glucan-1,4-alpha-glucosidase
VPARVPARTGRDVSRGLRPGNVDQRPGEQDEWDSEDGPGTIPGRTSAGEQPVTGGSPGDAPSAFPPIEDYALLADGETTALVAPNGAVEWMCAPRMDSPSLFAAVLDRDAGSFRLAPTESVVPVARRYLPGTLVLETTYMTGTGWLVVRDALLVAPWDEAAAGEPPPYRRVPRDRRAAHVLLRTARCEHGTVELALECDPVFDYGAHRGTWSLEPEGPGGVARVRRPDGDLELVLCTDLRPGVEVDRLRARTVLSEGDEAFVALSWSGARPPGDVAQAGDRLAETAAFWRDWLARGCFPDHPWRAHLQRSALVLKGLVYAPTGAMVAAATTSLPETLGGERNWDYRYTWVRDAAFTLWGLYTLGFDTEAGDFLLFVAEVAGGERDRLHIMYGIGGERELPERTLDHLSGYAGSRPVRVGNAASEQSQHDVWGMLLDAVHLHTTGADHLPDWLWPIVERQVEQACEYWREPDHGIWEVRGKPQHFTSSKVLCWVAMDRGARLARRRGEAEHERRWRALADEVHADVCARGVDDRGVFTQHYDTRALDASALLIPLMRFLPPDDPRVRATVLAVADELTEDGMVLRYKVSETDDGLSGEEGTFVICSFWLVSALVEIGEVDRARDLCQRLLAHTNDLGLLAEELDPRSGRHLGNTPQAFSHLALINAVMHVIRAERDRRGTGRFVPAHTTGSAR